MPKALRVLQIGSRLIVNEWLLAREVMKVRPVAVLLATYSEYLAPAWAWLQFVASRISGAAYVAVLHDPVRDFMVGPRWWHDLSVRMAYWPLSAVFVHEVLPSAAAVPPRMVVREVPHGLYAADAAATQSQSQVRIRWGVSPDAVVFLSFGFIRDGKNLDLLIRALPENPPACLVVMGRVASASVCRPVSFYEELAIKFGVSDRVTFIEGYVSDGEVGSYLAAADAIAITYSSAFHSQSGVLNTVASAGKPVLASSGDSPLKESVLRFGLGVFVPPDDLNELTIGMGRVVEIIQARRGGAPLPDNAPALDWDGYRRCASWTTNANVILAAVRQLRGEDGKTERPRTAST